MRSRLAFLPKIRSKLGSITALACRNKISIIISAAACDTSFLVKINAVICNFLEKGLGTRCDRVKPRKRRENEISFPVVL